MAFGPIDVVALEFQDLLLEGEILATLTELVASEVIRILDLVVIQKSAQGAVEFLELQDLEESVSRACEPLRAEVSGLITLADLHEIASSLRSDSCTLVMLFENLWAVRIRHEMVSAGGRLVVHERLPREVVTEALEDLARYV